MLKSRTREMNQRSHIKGSYILIGHLIVFLLVWFYFYRMTYRLLPYLIITVVGILIYCKNVGKEKVRRVSIFACIILTWGIWFVQKPDTTFFQARNIAQAEAESESEELEWIGDYWNTIFSKQQHGCGIRLGWSDKDYTFLVRAEDGTAYMAVVCPWQKAAIESDELNNKGEYHILLLPLTEGEY